MSQELTSSSQGGRPRTLGVFLKCTHDSPELVWNVTAHATIKLINHANSEKSYTKVFDHDFSQKSSDWGYSSFMKWKDVVDPTKGFVKDDSITLVSQIKIIRSSINGARDTPRPSLSSVLSCPSCYREFQARDKMQPLSLICGHSFCIECLQKSCTDSDGGSVKICCLLCNKDNSSTTRNNLWFPNHAMIQVISTGLVRKSKNLCDIHQHERSYYCFNDCILVCIYCAYHGEHSHHKCQHVDIAKKEMDKDLQKYKVQVMHKLSELERRVLLRTDERELLRLQKSGIITAVEKFYTELTSTLIKQKDSLLEELDTHTRNMDSAIEQSITALKDSCSENKLALKEYTKWQSLCPHEALSTVNAVQCTLQSASGTTSNVNDIPNTLSKITLEMPSLNVLSSVEHLGRLKVESDASPKAVYTLSDDKIIDCDSQKSSIDGPATEPPTKKRKEC